MAILATRRRCEFTSVWAAFWSPPSRQARARRSSSSWDSMGYLRISCIYRVRLVSGAIAERLEAIGWILLVFSSACDTEGFRDIAEKPTDSKLTTVETKQ